MITSLHHVQLACPRGSEPLLRAFYAEVLGMHEVVKPAELAARGGVWFLSGTAELHLGVEEPFSPARKAHPGLLVDDLDRLVETLRAAGATVTWDSAFPWHRRIHTSDPVGNRLELMSRDGTAFPT